MIHVPDHLVGFANLGQVGEETLDSVNYKIQPSEHGPLSYIVGYVVSKLNKACKGKSGEEKPELQALLQSLMVTEGEASNEFISVRSRGGLITPCEDIVRILHEAEIWKLIRLISFEHSCGYNLLFDYPLANCQVTVGKHHVDFRCKSIL